MDFGNPLLLRALFAIPVVVWALIYTSRRREADLHRFLGSRLLGSLAPGYSWRKNLLKGLMLTVGLALVVFSLAQPRFGSHLVKVEREGIDLVIALDTSLSMLAEDMLPSRLERAKHEIVDLIGGLKGDRVAIVAFAGDAFVLCPLTVDYDAALMFAHSINVDIVSEPGTAIDKAIEKSSALFEESTKRDRAIILVTDGEQHEGNPVEAATVAGEKGIRIFTIGVGNPAGELIPERGTDGSISGYKKDRRGQTVLTQLDETTLQQIATVTGGKYLPATREGLELKVLYNEIARMDQRAFEGEFVEQKKDHFWVFLMTAFALLWAEPMISRRATKRSKLRSLLHTGLGVVLGCLLITGVSEAKTVDRGKVNEGNRLFNTGKFDEAMKLYQLALGDTLKLPNNYHGVYYNKANTLQMQQKFLEAADVYKNSYSTDSLLTGNMLYNRGNALFNAKQLEPAVESYAQALRYIPDDDDTRHNLELALRLLEQQKEQQNQDQKNQNQDQQQQQQDGEQEDESDRSGESDPSQENQQQQPGKKDEGQESQQKPDSSQAQPQPDTTAVPLPELTPEDLLKMSREDALRILQALEEQERKLQQQRRKAAFRRIKRSGKDW